MCRPWAGCKEERIKPYFYVALRKPSFEWDERNDIENQRKHGVSFALAQRAFFDPNRVTARDLKHSAVEESFYLMGWAGGGVVTVRFTLREGIIRIWEPGIGAKERLFMKKRMAKKRVEYTDEPLDIEVITDFLPSPENLVSKNESVKVTISLTKNSVDFFKRQAKRRHVSYQAMIKKALDLYASHYQTK